MTLTGAGGSGKTRLALQVAAELLDGSGDGVWLVELAAISDEDAVASAIAQTLGIASQSGRPVLETLIEALVPQDILIVLDNCEHLITECAKVTDTIMRRCPKVHLLATSREPIGISGEGIYRVPSLSLPAPDSDLHARGIRCGRTLRGPGPISRRRPSARQGDGPSCGIDVSATRRDAPCYRAGGGPVALTIPT